MIIQLIIIATIWPMVRAVFIFFPPLEESVDKTVLIE